MNEKIKKFVMYLLEEFENHDIYVWGGQGEPVVNKTIKQILKSETSSNNPLKDAGRVIAHIGNIAKTYDISKAKCFDCSGLGTYYFLKEGLIKADCTANELLKKYCKKIDISNVTAGDLVFKVDASGKAVHVGYMINERDCVEMYGRDYGIMKCKLGAGSKFTVAGRPKFW